MKSVLLLVLFFLCPVLHASCGDLDVKGLEEFLKKEERVEIVFFASWCSACKKHFEEKTLAKRIFVATFDSKDAAEAVYSKYALSSGCFVDNGIAKKFGVKSLPHVMVWERGGFSKSSN